MRPANADADGVAASALVTGVIQRLVESGAMTKDGFQHLCPPMAQAESRTGQTHHSPVDAAAGGLIAAFAVEIEARCRRAGCQMEAPPDRHGR